MSKPYHPFSNRAGNTLKWGLVAILLFAIVNYWTNERRKLERQLSAMAGAISHHGSTLSPAWLNGLSSSIHDNCSLETTTVNVEGILNEALSQAQIIEGVTQVASISTDFDVRLEQVTVDVYRDTKRAQVNADAIIEVAHDGRFDREKRHVTITMKNVGSQYRLVSVEASSPITSQPEPRP